MAMARVVQHKRQPLEHPAGRLGLAATLTEASASRHAAAVPLSPELLVEILTALEAGHLPFWGRCVLVRGLRGCLAGKAFEQTLGLPTPRQLAKAARDAELRRALCMSPGESVGARCQALLQAIARYRRWRWRHAAPPPADADPLLLAIHEAQHVAEAAGLDLPRSVKQLRRIASGT
jgi:hypothetical protein